MLQALIGNRGIVNSTFITHTWKTANRKINPRSAPGKLNQLLGFNPWIYDESPGWSDHGQIGQVISLLYPLFPLSTYYLPPTFCNKRGMIWPTWPLWPKRPQKGQKRPVLIKFNSGNSLFRIFRPRPKIILRAKGDHWSHHFLAWKAWGPEYSTNNYLWSKITLNRLAALLRCFHAGVCPQFFVVDYRRHVYGRSALKSGKAVP